VKRAEPLTVLFYKTAAGREPVRDWLMLLTKEQRKTVGVDIWKTQSEWPVGMPQVRALGDGLHEVRSNFSAGIARTLFYVDQRNMILLHGFIKKNTENTGRRPGTGQKKEKRS
jgi:phage-related protein